MSVFEEDLRIVAHVVSETKNDCGCVDSMTARIVLRDSSGFNRAVLAVGAPQKDAASAIEDAIRKYESECRGHA